MKKSKLLVLGLLPLLLASCNTTNGEAEVDEEGNAIVKVLFHVDSKSKEGIAYKKLVDGFNREYASEKIKASATFKTRTAGGADYQAQLISAKLDDALADVITFDAPNCSSYAEAGLLHDITDEMTSEELDDFISVNTYQERIYGLPIQESSAGFYYNKALFAQAGIDVSGYTVENPWTFDEFKTACAKLLAIGKTPVDMRLNATKDETATYLLYPFIHAAGGSFVSKDGLTCEGYLNSEASIKGFQFFKDLVNANYTSYSVGDNDFVTGKAAMYLSSGWTIPELDNNYPEMFPNRDSWGLLPYPKDVNRASATGSWSYAVTNNHVKDKTNAIKLIKYLTKAESTTTVTNATGMIPSRLSCDPKYAANSPEAVLFEQLKQTGIARPETVGYPEFSTNFRNIIYKLKDGNVREVVNQQTANLQSELNEYK